VDLAWLHMESPYNSMMITVLVRFNGRISYPQLMGIMQEMVSRYRRFRQCIIIPKGIFQRPYWDDDPELSIENHIERVDLPLPADDSAVEKLANSMMNKHLEFNHPLWKFTLVDNHPAGSIIIVRVHHCIADGISLMHVLMQMTRVKADGLMGSSEPAVSAPDIEAEVTPTMIQALNDNASPAYTAKSTRAVGIRTPNVLDLLAAVVRIVARPADPVTILKGPLTETKKAVWSKPFSVPEIKKIAHSKGATINDVMMAVSSGASRRYMELHHDDRIHDIRAFILVNLRGRTIDEELGNNFGLVFLTMPVEKSQALERLDAIKQGMDWLKASSEYAATYLILKVLGQLPKWIESLAVRILDMKGTVVATNVPGSRKQLELAGAPIQSIIAWVPQSGRIGVGLSFISYNGELMVGLNADAALIPDPEVFLQLFAEEYTALKEAVAALAQ
jgi:diacylglycerol O-acyltransferase